MNALKIVAILFIVGGVFGLAYGGFNYTKETHSTDIGPLHLEVKEEQRVNIPLWVGIGGVVGGVLLLVLSSRKA
jgi:membrane associated rhomboid family serine protease